MRAPEVPVESLLEHAAFLRRLAGSLVADPAAADDLVQETWLAAVRRPPEGDRPVGGWLSTVLRNVGRRLRRSGGRRDRRERACARREAVPSAAEQAARGEVVREVVDAVFRLDPPQRAVVLMRFYEDLPPREIARRLEIPPNTVKSRLRLALAHLRADLDARSPTLRGDWRAALVPALGLGTASAGAGAAVAAGGVVMGTKTMISAGVALVVALGTVAYVALSDGTPERQGDPAPSLAGVPTPDGAAEGNRPTLAGAEPAPRQAPPAGTPPGIPAADAAPPAAAAPERPEITRTLLARLGFAAKTPPDTLEAIVLDGTTPVEGGTGFLWKPGGSSGPEGIPVDGEPTATRTLSHEGTFRFAGLADETWYLGVRLPDGVRRLLFRMWTTGKTENERGLLVLGDATVAGSVFDETGRPAARVRVRVSVQTGTDLDTTIAETRTDAQGAYEIGRLPAGMAWVAIAFGGSFDDSTRTRQLRVAVPAAARTTVDFGSRLGTARLTGTLRFRDGEAVRGERGIVLSRTGSGEYVAMQVAADGTYAQRVAAGSWRVNVWHATSALYGSSASTSLADELVVGADDLVHDIVLPGARIVGTLGPADATASRWVSIRLVSGESPTEVSTTVGKDGAYAWVAVRPGTYELRVVTGVGDGQLTSPPTRVVVAEGDGEIRRDLLVPR